MSVRRGREEGAEAEAESGRKTNRRCPSSASWAAWCSFPAEDAHYCSLDEGSHFRTCVGICRCHSPWTLGRARQRWCRRHPPSNACVVCVCVCARARASACAMSRVSADKDTRQGAFRFLRFALRVALLLHERNPLLFWKAIRRCKHKRVATHTHTRAST